MRPRSRRTLSAGSTANNERAIRKIECAGASGWQAATRAHTPTRATHRVDEHAPVRLLVFLPVVRDDARRMLSAIDTTAMMSGTNSTTRSSAASARPSGAISGLMRDVSGSSALWRHWHVIRTIAGARKKKELKIKKFAPRRLPTVATVARWYEMIE